MLKLAGRLGRIQWCGWCRYLSYWIGTHIYYVAYLGWNYVDSWVCETIGFSERSVVDRTEVGREEPGFIRRTLPKLNNVRVGMFLGQVATISSVLLLSVVARLLDVLIIHSRPNDMDYAEAEEIMHNIALLGQFLGVPYTP